MDNFLQNHFKKKFNTHFGQKTFPSQNQAGNTNVINDPLKLSQNKTPPKVKKINPKIPSYM